MCSIEYSDSKLLAIIAQLDSNKRMKSGFKATVSFILSSDPVAKNKAVTPNKSNGGMISDTNITISSASARDHNRSTGVDLRVHKRDEYSILSKEAKVTFRK